MYVEQSNEEWRQWIKLTEKKESTSSTSLKASAIDLLLTQIVELKEENSKLIEENKTLHFNLWLQEMDHETQMKKGYLDE